MKNEFGKFGSRGDRNLSLVEICKLMRSDIKAAKKSGLIPASAKISVRVGSGSSIDIKIKDFDGQLHSDVYLDWFGTRAAIHGPKPRDINRFSDEIEGTLEVLTTIHGLYNSDYSCGADYFDAACYRYYGIPSVSYKLENAELNPIAAAR